MHHVVMLLSVCLVLIGSMGCAQEVAHYLEPLLATREKNYDPQVQLDTFIEEVKSYGEFVFRRHLVVENDTEVVIKNVLEHLRTTLNESINVKLTTLRRQLATRVQYQVRKYSTAVHCADEVFLPVQDRIVDGLDEVDRCIDMAEGSLIRLRNTFDRDYKEYISVEEAALTGIKDCFLVQTDFSEEERTRCVKAPKDTFFSKGNAITERYFATSPFMNSFKKVARCIDEVADEIDSAIEQYVESLFSCARNIPDEELMRNIIAQQPEKGRYLINSTLASQIRRSQDHFYELNCQIEQWLLMYYNMEVEAKTTSLFEKRTKEDLMESTKRTLAPYLTAIDGVCVNPLDAETRSCVNQARSRIEYLRDDIIDASRHCDVNLVTDSNKLIGQIRSLLFSMVYNMSSTGNQAILACVMEGPLLKKNAIEKCHEISLNEINLQIKSTFLTKAQDTLNTLITYESTYFGLKEKTFLACDPMGLKSHLLKADRVLYNLGICLFNKSGIDCNITIDVDSDHANTLEDATDEPPSDEDDYPVITKLRYRRSADWAEDSGDMSFLMDISSIIFPQFPSIDIDAFLNRETHIPYDIHDNEL